MKKRILLDSLHMYALMGFTIYLFFFNKELYPQNHIVDDIFDFLGVLTILKGVLFRMAGRAHKAKHSSAGGNLVTSGVYKLMRNPMYFGSFMIGAGFCLIVWPWWALPIFICGFYLRFMQTIIKEEESLKGVFGSGYQQYCDETPRIFPKIKTALMFKTKDMFNSEIFRTKETRYFYLWPVVALVFESIQEWSIYGDANVLKNFINIFAAIVIWSITLFVMYKVK